MIHLVFVFTVVNFLLLMYLLHKVIRIHCMAFESKYQSKQLINKDELSHTIQNLQAIEILRNKLNVNDLMIPVHGWSLAPDGLLKLVEYVQKESPSVILECGSGVSTVIIAYCLQMNGKGHIYSLEHEQKFAQITRDTLKKRKLDKWSTVITAPLETLSIEKNDYFWYSLNSIPKSKFDMIIVDGPPYSINPMARYPAIPVLLDHLTKNGSLFLDDAERKEEKEIVRRWIEEFPELYQYFHHTSQGLCQIFRQYEN